MTLLTSCAPPLLPSSTSSPPSIWVSPVQRVLPDSVRVPSPALVRLPGPEIIPASASVVDGDISNFPPPCPNITLRTVEISAPVASVALFNRVRLPLASPSDSSVIIDRVPLLTVHGVSCAVVSVNCHVLVPVL
ncbi:hypothetical protein D3C73_1060950 [compost metagenome]